MAILITNNCLICLNLTLNRPNKLSVDIQSTSCRIPMIELDAKYNHSEYEKESINFGTTINSTLQRDESKTPFTILMPPNVTSQLHMGHGTDTHSKIF